MFSSPLFTMTSLLAFLALLAIVAMQIMEMKTYGMGLF
jgi:hypothetical protein